MTRFLRVCYRVQRNRFTHRLRQEKEVRAYDLYAIIPFEPSEKLRSNIDGLDVPVYAGEAPAVYFVSFKGTTNELSEAVGYGDDRQAGTGVVISISNYSGFASRDLWEWMELQQNGG